MKNIFLNNKFILTLIILNALLIFIGGFELAPNYVFLINILDHIITVLFVVEVVVKLSKLKFNGYFSSGWNILDFILTTISIPSLIIFLFDIDFVDMSFILVFRVLRIFKTFRFMKFIPGIEELLNGVQRALKSSVFILIAFVVYIYIIGVLSFYFFRSTSPEYFNDPLTSLYSIFKVFTIEGWFNIPDQLAQGQSQIMSFLIHAYFIFILLTGGIFGMSLVNSIFVDAMVSDNNDELEKKVEILIKKIDELSNK